jgi:hypothetical protein
MAKKLLRREDVRSLADKLKYSLQQRELWEHASISDYNTSVSYRQLSMNGSILNSSQRGLMPNARSASYKRC